MKRLQAHYEANFLAYEFGISLLLALGIVAFTELALGREHLTQLLSGVRQGIYSAIASIAGSLLGFILATVSIIKGFIGAPSLQIVRESKHYATLYTAFFTTIRYLALTTFVALMALLFDRDSAPIIWLSYAVVWVVLASSVGLYRCIWFLERIIHLATKKSGNKA